MDGFLFIFVTSTDLKIYIFKISQAAASVTNIFSIDILSPWY